MEVKGFRKFFNAMEILRKTMLDKYPQGVYISISKYTPRGYITISYWRTHERGKI